MTAPVINAANNLSITQYNINQHRQQWRRFVTPASIVQYRGILFGPKAKANLMEEKMY